MLVSRLNLNEGDEPQRAQRNPNIFLRSSLCPLWLTSLLASSDFRRCLDFVSGLYPRGCSAGHIQKICEAELLGNAGGCARSITTGADDCARTIGIQT